MGRPLNKKYFGNRNIGAAGTTDNGIGGNRIASVTIGGVNDSTGYSSGDPVTFSAPELPGGVTATGAVITAGPPDYAIAGITIIEAGSGYTSVPTVTVVSQGTIGTTTLTAVFQVDTGAVGSSTNQENAIVIRANTTGLGGTKVGDIIKQSSARRYKVKTADDTAICKLVATNDLGIFDAYIVATDDNGNTYFVTKLTARKASLYRKTQNGANAWLYANGASVKWALDSTNNCVRIENA
jgi:hypothetical protein